MVSFTPFLLFGALAMAAPAQQGAGEPKSLNKRFNGGWCGVHVHTFNGENEKGSHEMNVYVYDGKKQLVWQKESIWGNGQLYVESEGLPDVLNVNTFGPGDDVVSGSFLVQRLHQVGVYMTNNLNTGYLYLRRPVLGQWQVGQQQRPLHGRQAGQPQCYFFYHYY